MLYKIPIIVHSHDEDRNYPLHQKLADRLLTKFTDKSIAISESVKQSCIKKRKMSEEKIFVIHNGIPLQDFSIPEKDRIQRERTRFGITLGFNVIGTVARLREEKGHYCPVNNGADFKTC